MRLRVKWCLNTNGYMLSHSASLFSRYLILYAPTALSALHYRYHHAHIKPSWVIVLYGCAQSISIYRAHYECDIFGSPFQNVGSELRKNERCVINNRAKKMKGWHILWKALYSELAIPYLVSSMRDYQRCAQTTFDVISVGLQSAIEKPSVKSPTTFELNSEPERSGSQPRWVWLMSPLMWTLAISITTVMSELIHHLVVTRTKGYQES